jgi:hypothetical protein
VRVPLLADCVQLDDQRIMLALLRFALTAQRLQLVTLRPVCSLCLDGIVEQPDQPFFNL